MIIFYRVTEPCVSRGITESILTGNNLRYYCTTSRINYSTNNRMIAVIFKVITTQSFK